MRKILFFLVIFCSILGAESFYHSDVIGGGGGDVDLDSLAVIKLTAENATIDTLNSPNFTGVTGIIKTDSTATATNILQISVPDNAVDGQIYSMSFLAGGTLEVLKIGTMANGDGSGGVYADSSTVWIIDQPHVFAYVTTADTTVCPTAGEDYTLQATFSNVDIKGFSSSVDGITFLGYKERKFTITGSWGGSTNGTNTTIQISIYKNGILEVGSSSPPVYCKVANEAYDADICPIVTLKRGDLITIKVRADGDGDIINTTHFPIRIDPL